MPKLAEKRKKLRLPPMLLPAAGALLLALLLLLTRSGRHRPAEPEVEAEDPHAGQVLVNDGAAMVWITPAANMPASPLRPSDFTQEGGWPAYIGDDCTVLRGVDVADYQAGMDWVAARAAGIDFAFIRCGYRGYEKGLLYEDGAFADSMSAALEAGIQAGVYFFSQATTPDEAAEEARFVLEITDGYDFTLPVMWDFEYMTTADARANAVHKSDLTDLAQAFCTVIEEGGRRAGIYFNRQLGYYAYDWGRLGAYARWVADPGPCPDFYYATDVWQYSFGETVPGFDIITDMNLMFLYDTAEEP